MQAKLDRHRFASWYLEAVVCRGFRAGPVRIDRFDSVVYHEVVKRVLRVATAAGNPEEPFGIGLVFGEEKRRQLAVRARTDGELVVTDRSMLGVER